MCSFWCILHMVCMRASPELAHQSLLAARSSCAPAEACPVPTGASQGLHSATAVQSAAVTVVQGPAIQPKVSQPSLSLQLVASQVHSNKSLCVLFSRVGMHALGGGCVRSRLSSPRHFRSALSFAASSVLMLRGACTGRSRKHVPGKRVAAQHRQLCHRLQARRW